ncbi:MAG: hypothetical protein AAF975_08830, partial [Spirochaetota bacterium]
MKTLHRMVFQNLIPTFIGLLFIAVILFELVYFFGEMTRYLDDEELQASDYLYVLGMYVPLAI